ncbi:MAG: hypothetical protein ACRCT8_16220 [Lacipirellulaceae bacterium]
MVEAPERIATAPAPKVADQPSINGARSGAFLRAFVVTFVLGLVAAAALNLAVDPYGQYGTGLLPAITRTSRGEKIDLLRAAKSPEGLLLGSSRAMKFETSRLAERTGLRFFNAAVYYGRPEDYLALVRASHDLSGDWPRMVVVGVDVDAFVETPGVDGELLRNPFLRGLATDSLTWDDRLRPLRELLSWQQSVSSLRSLRRVAGATPADHDETFAPTGEIVYHRRERERAAGTYDFAAALSVTQDDYTRLYARYRRLSPRRVATWRALCALCREHDVTLHAFVTTWRPELVAELDKAGRLAARRDDVLKLLAETIPAGGRVADFTMLDSFDGDPTAFFDGIHPIEANTRKMIDALLGADARAAAGGRLAVQ